MTLRHLLSESWRAVRGNGEIFLLLVLLQAAVNTLIFKLANIDIAGLETIDPQDSRAFAEILRPLLPAMFWSAVLTIAFYSAISVVWCRVLGAGRDRVFKDNFAARFLLVIWRYVGMAGYSLLLIVGFVIVSIPFSALARLLGDSLGGILSLLLTGLLLVGFLAIFLALLLSVASTALGDGKGRGLLASAQGLGAGWRPYLAAGVVFMATYMAVSLMVAGMMLSGMAPDGGTDLPLPALILSSAIGALVNLALLALAVTAWRSVSARRSE